MSSKVDIQRNKLIHLENTLVMYGMYNVETLEELMKTVHALCSQESMYEKLFAGQLTKAYEYYSQMHGDHGIQHGAINSMLYLRTIKDECTMNLSHRYTIMQRQLEFWLKDI